MDGKKPVGLVYDALGLVAALRVKGQKPEALAVGEGGLGGATFRDLNAETAPEQGPLIGVVGGEKERLVGLDGEARGMMSRGSGSPAA